MRLGVGLWGLVCVLLGDFSAVKSFNVASKPRTFSSRATVSRSTPGTDEKNHMVSKMVTPASSASLSSDILNFYASLDELYNRSVSIRCPFFRRRAADLIDSVAMVLRFLLIRHKSLGIFDPFLFLDDEETSATLPQPPGCRAVGRHVTTNADGTICKNRNLDVATIADTIRADWVDAAGDNKGYYITGRLNSTIYRDDCIFDGPDPDMPVRGLRKYLSAASHLFDQKRSRAELLSLDYSDSTGSTGDNGIIVATWKLEGVLMLPWRPVVKPWTGTTTYHLDEEGLIYFHEEEWDISVMEAFICTVWPEIGERIWGSGASNADARSVDVLGI